MQSYVPLVQDFSSRVVFFHAIVAEKLGLHLTDLKSLHVLSQQPMTAGILGERIGLSGPAVTALIDRLEKAGYVSRERDLADRRRITIVANPEKLIEVDSLYNGQYIKMSKLLSKYSKQEFDVILSFLERTTDILTEEANSLRTE
jgi:DNA-binding MarR family transcriptional regulator